ncbi:replication initiator protein A [Lactobacillus amylovorus]|nr:replication initiator protein A [Lactobacillus amylovorus]MDB6226773.1 replication initiator protein A [Lactobacillus amylovorus]
MTESQNKGWIDDDGNIYIIYSDEDLMKECTANLVQ